MNNRKIDDLDLKILNILQEDGKVSNAEIARKVGKAPSAVLERVRKLRKSGIIKGYECIVDHKKLGRGLTAFTSIRVEEGVGATEVGEKLARLPEVLEVHYTAGRDSYLVKVRVEDTEALQATLAKFGTIGAVRDTNSTIVLTTVKESRVIPLPVNDE
ncbi:MAG: Lrp/AsnC family transcriptional regulator [Pseudodesulfovibrio sp.]|uniref:Transcription regulator AsnC-type-like protein n=1 Tax=Pseudodesulfovibrio aespoeensis (strain ATCC 700646 / DSM 10631 / Aspo-2) TaxID=643562 RepID=E6VSX5_PSEA9|nr:MULTISPECIES: Lrp/AsnC family transcriptional regulator [Pseudodesulfovibrio]MBU4192052.1 Lrp/AsnC family transcriptional regulator [Pseudomonadota bacterium]ADU63219.1 Transcription regulator AsnC-type-like protein [Pseudodesulfovibrio aespoeensis Aspo-2]MBU4243727.1 Lrp/AsnC family transcriptional regulator [Pseudomonadota bacterium]MBU4377959.1 Lrp/AsnC family transcriptional regulator [Pseudomonadota bacterium]MBU4475116.1 Lrp/AsnC family transcriptional regulator [Pseudomonadota bacter